MTSKVPDPTAGPSPEDVYVVDVIRRVLVDRWDDSETFGYDPRSLESTDAHLPIHGGHYDDTIDDPQISIRPVSSTSRTSSGLRGFNADGSGSVYDEIALADINVWAGTYDSIGRDPDPDQVADAIGKEVYRILTSIDAGLIDPESSTLITEHIAPRGKPVVGVDPESNPSLWRAILEVVSIDSTDSSER